MGTSSSMFRSLLGALALSLLLARPALAGALPASGPTPGAARFEDDGDRASLLLAIARTEAYFAKAKPGDRPLLGKTVSLERLKRSLARFKALVETAWGTPAFAEALEAEFERVPLPGDDHRGTVRFTGYYLPLLEAAEKPDARFRYPLYAPPADLVSVALGDFDPALAGRRIVGRAEAGRLVPYFDRQAIDDAGALAGRGLEIAWVDSPMARFSLMIQGSGLLRYRDGRIANVNYAAQNGRKYVAIGRPLIADGKIPAEKMSMPAIEAYFEAHPEERGRYFNQNPSYVFFALSPEGPFGCDGVALTPGRAIATDKRQSPSGALVHVRYPKARFDAAGQVIGWDEGTRFVIDQDTGGAILGPGRIDFYLGGGAEAAKTAGTLNGTGRAEVLLLKAP